MSVHDLVIEVGATRNFVRTIHVQMSHELWGHELDTFKALLTESPGVVKCTYKNRYLINVGISSIHDELEVMARIMHLMPAGDKPLMLTVRGSTLFSAKDVRKRAVELGLESY